MSQVDEPVDRAHHERPADNVSDSYREQIADQKVCPSVGRRSNALASAAFPHRQEEWRMQEQRSAATPCLVSAAPLSLTRRQQAALKWPACWVSNQFLLQPNRLKF